MLIVKIVSGPPQHYYLLPSSYQVPKKERRRGTENVESSVVPKKERRREKERGNLRGFQEREKERKSERRKTIPKKGN